MKYFNTLQKVFASRLAILLAVLTGNIAAALADNTVSMADFTIKAGETKEVAVELTSASADVFAVSGTISLPAGLQFVSYSSTVHAKAAARTNGANVVLNPVTGVFNVYNLFKNTFTDNSGEVLVFQVKASDNFKAGVISYSNLQVKRTGNIEETATGTNTTVTLEQGTPTPEPGDDDPVTPGVNNIAFSQSVVKIAAGGTATIDLNLNNGDAFTGIGGVLVASNGISIEKVEATSRLAGGFNFSAKTGKFAFIGAIAGNSGAVMTITVKAATDFAGTATLSAQDIATTNSSAQSTSFANQEATFLADGIDFSAFALNFANSQINLVPGSTLDVPVMMTADSEITGFAAQLSLPAGVTAVVKAGALISNAPNYVNAKIAYLGAASAQQGELFILTLTADDNFNGGELTLSKINATGKSAVSIYAEDVTLTISPKDEAAYQAALEDVADLQQKLDDAKSTIASDYPAAAEDEDIVKEENGIQEDINTLKADIDEAYEDNTLNADEVATDKAAIEAAIEKLLADAAAKQAEADEKAAEEAQRQQDYEQALATVEDLQQKFDNKVAEIANTYPAAADDQELLAEEAAIQKDIDALRQKIEEDNAAKQLDLAAVEAAKTPISEAIDALDAKAAEIQAAAEEAAAKRDANEQGKKAIDDEIAELRRKLFEAWWICPDDLPEDVNKKLGEEYDGIGEAINELAAEYQALYDAVELSADATLDAEKKQAIVDAIDALIAKIKQWQRGDVEFDLDVDMDDFYALTDSILKENLPAKERKNAFYRFDANADEAINVGDMQGIVNICLGLKADGALFSRQSEQQKAELSVKSEATATGMRYTLSVSGMSYTGFQLDVRGAQVVSESSALTVRKSDNGSKTRILALGMEQQEGQVVTIETTGSARLENVILTQADAQTVTFDLSGTTGISAVAAGQSAEKSYNLSGREVKQARGLVISGGKKMIRK